MKSDSSVVENAKLGKNVSIWNFCNIYGCEIGDDTSIASHSEIQKGVKIGRKCLIENGAFICSGTIIGNEVFIGPGVKFTNDNWPRATRIDGTRRTYDTDVKKIRTVVNDRASIGAMSVIKPGVAIGVYSMVGMGSVVTKDVPPYKIVAGNPAKEIGDVRKRLKPKNNY